MSRHEAAETTQPLVSNKLYDVLKYIALIALPAIGALYFSIAQIWGLPAAEEVVGTIVAVDTFLGVLLGLSTKQYNQSEERYDGALVVDTSFEDKDVYSFEVTAPLEDLRNRKELTIQVKQQAA